MKVISFLGTGKYQEAEYVFPDGFALKERLFPFVLISYLLKREKQPLDILVMVSQEVIAHENWAELEGKFKALRETRKISWKPVIYEWKNQKGMWGVFSQLDEAIGEGERIILDITHSFRFIPFIMVMMINYLEKIKGGEIAGVYYGNFEAKGEKTGQVPVFEISQFMKMLDWTFAVEFFFKTGNAKLAAELLKKENAELFKSGESTRNLGSFSNLIGALSSCLINLDWKGARRKREGLLKLPVETLEAEVKEKLPFASPLIRKLYTFGTSLNLGEGSWEKLGLDELKWQLELVRWYFDFGYYRNAVLLAKEFIVNSWLYVNGVREGWLKEEVRRVIEGNLTKIVYNPKAKEDIIRAINSIMHKRNAVAHALMKDNEMPNLESVKEFVFSLDLDKFLKELEEVKKKYEGVKDV